MYLDNPIFHDEDKAREHLEAVRWPNGPFCPHCGEAENVRKLEGKSHRPGLYQCRSCRQQFTVTVGTVFERSKVPIHKWLLATHLMCASKKGYSAHQLHRTIGVTYKTAWFMAHRIREAMRENSNGPLGSGGGTVEADETYWGNTRSKKRQKPKGARGYAHKEKIVSLVERGGRVRSDHVPEVNAETLRQHLTAQIHQSAKLMTDESSLYTKVGREFADHGVVNHSIDEYVRGSAHTNTIEGYFSILKRGLKGTYHHVEPHHLKRYVGEFDFRYNYRIRLGYDDTARAEIALRGIGGKRLTYRRPHSTNHAIR